MVESIEGILTIEKPEERRYLLKSEEKAEVPVGWRKRLILTRNPKDRGSNPLPATKDFKDLHRFGVSPFY
jgi:hypothetical protein